MTTTKVILLLVLSELNYHHNESEQTDKLWDIDSISRGWYITDQMWQINNSKEQKSAIRGSRESIPGVFSISSVLYIFFEHGDSFQMGQCVHLIYFPVTRVNQMKIGTSCKFLNHL